MRISVENYKSISKKMSININGMTIIAGANSSGKSSFMQPFMILKQTLENNSDGQALIINGENANLTESQQIFCKKNKNKKSFSLSWENFNKKKEVIESSKIEFGYTSKEGFTALEASNNDITIKKGMSVEELETVLEPLKEKEGFLKEIFQSMKSENKLIPRLKTEKSFLCIEMVPE
ncbi:AAA family ATPase, partial [Acinetobacter junii]